jgi:hypothetical protein
LSPVQLRPLRRSSNNRGDRVGWPLPITNERLGFLDRVRLVTTAGVWNVPLDSTSSSSEGGTMSQSDDIAHLAGDHVGFVADFALEDTRQRKLRYHLLRLTVAGVTQEDVAELGELARLAFEDSDVSAQTTRIKERAGTSPLAFAIADIVEQTPRAPGPLGQKAAMLGAVLGAYTSLKDVGGIDQVSVATLGAVGGALAMTASNIILTNLEQVTPAEYLRMDE